MSATDLSARASKGLTLLAYPFRPFFLLAGLYGAVLILAWIAFLFAGLPLPLGVVPAQWHAHELLFGLVPAAVAGFLLTAMTNWTGAAPLRGAGLLALVGLWLAGRVVMWASGVLPPLAVAVVDLSFLPVVAVYAGRVLQRAGSTRNLGLAAVVGVFALANLVSHLGFAGVLAGGARLGEVLALDLVTVLMVVIGGRITPAFTANWLRMRGDDPGRVRRVAVLDRAAVALTVAMVPADLALGYPAVGGAVALAAGVAVALRMAGWGTGATLREPLLWVLHLGYAWIAAALLIKGLAAFLDGAPATLWFHALGAGAIGTMVLGVMTRVGVGHTGRPLRLPRYAPSIYAAVTAGTLLRLLAAGGAPGYVELVTAGGVLWALAFALFVVFFWPILSRPRPDGQPG